ncbi:MAG: hypothetical protein AAF957_26955 [Planctomycetota bacterium]
MTTRRIAWSIAALVLVALVALDRPAALARGRGSMGPAQRLLGPIASVAASVEWIRFRVVLDGGDPARAYGHARRALDLDARTPAGWVTLADHFVFGRASPLEAEDAAERRKWIRAGLDVLERGERRTAAPEDLAFYAAVVKATFLAGIPDEALGWPGGPRALLEDARRDAERALELGGPDAAAVLEFIAERLRDLDEEGR